MTLQALTPDDLPKAAEAERTAAAGVAQTIHVCMAAGCLSQHSDQVKQRCKAVQTGGPSGGCIPAEYLETPVDYESLGALGSIMGSGGMIVMDEHSCMVDVARFFMEFSMSESCGKCVPCRVGTAEMYELLTRIGQGRATLANLELLQELCETVKYTSLCGLGQAAPNPVLSTLRFFQDEYLAHITNHVCPAGLCQFEEAREQEVQV
jgi:bidirectional [NiFe] hydrogenase diaphorase subunit